ncbi:polysaccharide lyase 6 family protein [Tenuifilum thalassicum]|nr:polysaccharide lyase 6 family protein [Tenuifilum thalassicum]
MKFRNVRSSILNGRMNFISMILFATLLTLNSGCSNSNQILVSDVNELNQAIKDAKPGDKIVLKNGNWKDAELLINAKGTPEDPIIITAQEKGKVFLTGLSNLRISGEYVEVSGLVFKDGYTPTSEVISFREKKGVYANHCRLTECVIDNFNNPERENTELWVALYGKNNRVDHCYFTGKRSNGVTFAIRMVDEACRNNNHQIDHNYFGYRQNLGSNGGETMRLGTSHYSLSTCGANVEANYFEYCDGEHEIISNKSCGNTFKNNTFFKCRGTLTFRHGHDNTAEGNFFIGNGKDHTGGIRIINERNKAINNYFYNLKGYRFRGALVIMNGIYNSPINRYNQVIGGVFSNNTFVNCDHVQLCAGSDSERTAPPIDSKIENNVFYHDSKDNIFTVYDDISGISFSNNYINTGVKPLLKDGFTVVDMKLVENESGFLFPVSDQIKNAGCSLSSPVATKENTGVTWYPIVNEELTFDNGKVIKIEPGLNSLFDAVESSEPGDIIILAKGEYVNSKVLSIKHPLTIKSEKEKEASILSEKNNMFQIENGGALKLIGVKISGSESPDMAGNSIISTSKYSMNRNYKLIVENCDIEDLTVNHSFDFLRIYKSTFADSIVFRNCNFLNVSGNIASLDKETDDLGIYNAEYVVYENCTFKNIGGVILNLYRGGTDESTFGPILKFVNNKVFNSGKNKRNKIGCSLYLHGVQWAKIDSCNFIDSAPIKLNLSKDEPIIKFSNINIYPKVSIISNSNEFSLINLTHKKQ